MRVLGKDGAKFLKYAKGAGVVDTAVGVGISSYNIFSGNATTLDYFDAGVGVTALGSAIFLASNPIGWTIAIGAAIYFTGRLAYDIYTEFKD